MTKMLTDNVGRSAGRSPVYDVIGHRRGRPLDADLRRAMEARLGESFDRVRLHVDARSTESVDAKAYTVGEEIVVHPAFANLRSTGGRQLLAHELAHVVQQRCGPVDGTSAPGGIKVSDPGDRFEQEADAIGREAPPAVNREVEPGRVTVQRLLAGPVNLQQLRSMVTPRYLTRPSLRIGYAPHLERTYASDQDILLEELSAYESMTASGALNPTALTGQLASLRSFVDTLVRELKHDRAEYEADREEQDPAFPFEDLYTYALSLQGSLAREQQILAQFEPDQPAGRPQPSEAIAPLEPLAPPEPVAPTKPVAPTEAPTWMSEGLLKRLRFRVTGGNHWQRDFNKGGDHISMFHSGRRLEGNTYHSSTYYYEFTSFHVTFVTRRGNIQYHWTHIGDRRWQQGGHTASKLIREWNEDPDKLNDLAREVAHDFIDKDLKDEEV